MIMDRQFPFFIPYKQPYHINFLAGTSKQSLILCQQRIRSCVTNTPKPARLVLNGSNSAEKYRKRLLPNAVPLLEWNSAPSSLEYFENCSPSLPEHSKTLAKATRQSWELAEQRAKEKRTAAERGQREQERCLFAPQGEGL